MWSGDGGKVRREAFPPHQRCGEVVCGPYLFPSSLLHMFEETGKAGKLQEIERAAVGEEGLGRSV